MRILFRILLLAGTLLWVVNLVLIPQIACAQSAKDRKFEVGVHVSTLGIDDPHTTSPPAIPGSARRELGFGGRLGQLVAENFVQHCRLSNVRGQPDARNRDRRKHILELDADKLMAEK